MSRVDIRRKPLVPNKVTPIYAPWPSHGVTIGNASDGDLRVYSQDDDESHFLVIGARLERTIQHSNQIIFGDDRDKASLYLNAIAGGEAVLEWLP